MPAWLRRCLSWIVRGTVAVLILAALACAIFTSPRNIPQYAARAESPYHLPWPAGITHRCIQGNRAVVSHRGFDEFAYDFAMPVGSEVCAARSGTVLSVLDTHDGNGRSAPNNAIAIVHEDGTNAWYLHIRRGGATVRKGDRVTRGQKIAESGNVGRSMMPHLHFHVTNAAGDYLPVTFSDVSSDLGIPRMFKTYTSQPTFSRSQ